MDGKAACSLFVGLSLESEGDFLVLRAVVKRLSNESLRGRIRFGGLSVVDGNGRRSRGGGE